MTINYLVLIALSLVEVVLLVLLLVFFFRLRRSQALLNKLQSRQEEFLNRIDFNSELEHQMLVTFEQRQQELAALDQALTERTKELEDLIVKADKIVRSPQSMKNVILSGYRQGRTIPQLAKATGLAVDEIELILKSNPLEK